MRYLNNHSSHRRSSRSAPQSLGGYFQFVKTGIIILAVVAVVRFILGVMGVPSSIGSHVASMTYVGFILIGYYAFKARREGFTGYKQLLQMSFALEASRGLIIIIGILITAALGIGTYFESETLPLGIHILAHVAGILGGTLPFWGICALIFRFTRTT